MFCEWKDVTTLKVECYSDIIHMLLEISPKMSVFIFIEYLEGKSSLMLYERFGELKFKYRNREFECWGEDYMDNRNSMLRSPTTSTRI